MRNAPPPASLVLSHSIAHGSLSLACDLASAELITTGTGTPISGSVNLSRRRKSIRKVRSSTATNCSGFSSEPARIWKLGARAQRERHRHVVQIPRFGKLRLDLGVVVMVDAVGIRLRAEGDQAV